MKNKLTKWTIDLARKAASKYTTLKDFKSNDRLALRWIYFYKHYDLLNHLEGRRVFWTRESVKKQALKYNTRMSFHRNCPGAYNFASKKGILKEICVHMGPPKVKIKKYSMTLEIAKSEALKYRTKKEFTTADPYTLKWCRINKVDDIVCAHMIRSRRKKFKNVDLFHKEDLTDTKTILRLMKERGVLVKLQINPETSDYSCVINSIIDPVFHIDEHTMVDLHKSGEVVVLPFTLDGVEKQLYMKHIDYALPDRCLK